MKTIKNKQNRLRTALITHSANFPVTETHKIIESRLIKDGTLSDRTKFPVNVIMKLKMNALSVIISSLRIKFIPS